MLTRVSRARLRCRGSARDPTASPVTASTSSGEPALRRQTQLGSTFLQPSPIGGGRRVAEREFGELVDGVTGCQQRPADPIGSRQHGLADEVAPECVELCHRKAVEGIDESGPRRHSPIDLLGGEVVLENHLGVPHPRLRC